MGNAMLRRLVGMRRGRHTQVLATKPIRPGLQHVSAQLVPAALQGQDDFTTWPVLPADIAVVLFDPPRLFYGREKALWTPMPHQLPALGGWLEACGVHTLAVVLPHAPGTLPESLKHGLAGLDEQTLAALGIARLMLVRSAQKPGRTTHRQPMKRLASWMLGITSYMVPSTEQPVRSAKIAEFVDMAMRELPQGSHVFAPELVWQAAQGDSAHMRRLLRHYAAGRPSPAANDALQGIEQGPTAA